MPNGNFNMDFENLLNMTFSYANKSDLGSNFKKFIDELKNIIFDCNISDIINIINYIGFIPECISHDSREEKLYTKVSEIF